MTDWKCRDTSRWERPIELTKFEDRLYRNRIKEAIHIVRSEHISTCRCMACKASKGDPISKKEIENMFYERYKEMAYGVN